MAGQETQVILGRPLLRVSASPSVRLGVHLCRTQSISMTLEHHGTNDGVSQGRQEISGSNGL